MCFTRSQFFASARKLKIIQNMLFLRGIMQVSVRNLHVLRCVLTRHARKPLFLRGIVHVRYVKIVYRLSKNMVVYEVSIFSGSGVQTAHRSESVVFTRDHASHCANTTCFTMYF